MKKFILFFSLFIFSCSEETIFFENSYVIENINIIDPIDGLSSNKTVVITKNKITEIFNLENETFSQQIVHIIETIFFS